MDGYVTGERASAPVAGGEDASQEQADVEEHGPTVNIYERDHGNTQKGKHTEVHAGVSKDVSNQVRFKSRRGCNIERLEDCIRTIGKPTIVPT